MGCLLTKRASPKAFSCLLSLVWVLLEGTPTVASIEEKSVYLDYVQSSLSQNQDIVMRWPSDNWLQALVDSEVGYSTDYFTNYFIERLPNPTDARLSFGIFDCDEKLPSCLLGTLSTSESTSESALAALSRHQAGAAPITLASGTEGYFLEGSLETAKGTLSSVAWVQDAQIYVVYFPMEAKQTGLYLARSMAISQPLLAESTLIETEYSSNTHTLSAERPVARIEQLSNISIAQSPTEEPPLLEEEDLEPVPPTPSVDTDALGEPERQDPTEDLALSTIEIRNVVVEDSTLFEASDFLPIYEEVGIQPDLPEGETQRVSLPQLRNIANSITQLYVSRGYITSLATPPEAELSQGLVNGNFVIEVIEGKIADIEITRIGEDSEDGEDANARSDLRDDYILSRVRLGLSDDSPLRIDLIEEQLRLLQEDSNIAAIEATLEPTTKPGLSNLNIEINEASPIAFGFGIDNYSPPRVGSERMSADLAYRNLTGIGDILSVGYTRTTTGGVSAFDFRYAVPVNPMDGTLQLQIAPERSEITQPEFSAFGLAYEVDRYGISFRQPIIRTLNEEFALSAGFDYQRGQTFRAGGDPAAFTFGPDGDGVTRTSVFSFGQDYVSRDIQGAWALRSKLFLGTGLFDATANESSIPDGQFFSWLFQAQRLQRLNEKNLLIMSADLQLTPDTLLPAQRFAIGGGSSIRGFRQSVRSGDNGFRFSVEDRITLARAPSGAPEFQLAPFFDMGMVWNSANNPNRLLDQNFLAGIGVGGIWDNIPGAEGLNFRVDYALPLVDLNDRGNNIQDSGIYFRVNYRTD